MKRLLCALALVAFAAAPALADPKSDVTAAMIQFAKASSYHMEIDSKRGAMEADFAAPGKMHVSSPQFEMIKIDATTWVKIGGKWQQFAMPGMDQMTGAFSTAVATVKSQSDDMVVTDLGMKSPAAGGRPLHAYTVINNAGKIPSTLFLDGGRLSEVDNADGSSVKFSKFDAPVDIEPPM
jgi:hypothetical protein